MKLRGKDRNYLNSKSFASFAIPLRALRENLNTECTEGTQRAQKGLRKLLG